MQDLSGNSIDPSSPPTCPWQTHRRPPLHRHARPCRAGMADASGHAGCPDRRLVEPDSSGGMSRGHGREPLPGRGRLAGTWPAARMKAHAGMNLDVGTDSRRTQVMWDAAFGWMGAAPRYGLRPDGKGSRANENAPRESLSREPDPRSPLRPGCSVTRLPVPPPSPSRAICHAH